MKTNKENERLGLQNLHSKWLVQNKVSKFRTFNGEFSRVDGIFYSGDTNRGTDVVFEYKIRRAAFFEHQFGTYIQKDKWYALRTTAQLLDAKCLYIVEYDDAIFLFDLTNRNNLEFSPMTLQKSDQPRAEDVLKEIGYLHFKSADFILSKKNGFRTRIGNQEMFDFLQLKLGMITANEYMEKVKI